MRNLINTFSHNIETLRTFVIGIEPVLNAQREENFTKNKESLLPLLVLLNKTNPEEFPLGEEERQLLIDKYKIEITEETEKGMKFSMENEKESYFGEALKEIHMTDSQIKMLYQNSLMNLVVYFENVISSLIKEHIEKFPNINKKTISFENLQKFNSIEDAFNFLIEKEVHDLMYDGFEDWIKYIKNNLNLSMGYINPFTDNIIEIIQRRNLFVHNRGIVNTIYLSKVNKTDYSVGDKISIDREYLDNAIDLIEQMGVLILLEYWKKIDTSDVYRAKTISDLVNQHLKNEKWTLTKAFSYFLMNDKGLNEVYRLTGQLNYWLSMKRLGNFKEIEKQLMAEDFSAKKNDFQLCLLALQERKDEFFKLLPITCPSEISYKELNEWTIFNDVRQLEQFQEFIKKENLLLEQP
ncbi:hypothetical protein ACIQY5_14070 [Peribacillus frigoritolerans]|uniref:hypothetical protein n=1 Tax=Peribacillus frigoritolerans TaxID=450367 RepID=UPI0037F8DF77